MTASKFVEIFDSNDATRLQDGLTLDQVLAETRQRSASADSFASSSTSASTTKPPSPTPSANQPIKTRLRAFSLRRDKT
ncbi:hypothetical protein LTR74_013351 [Friedmanniomyces endolithicus]|nr:hypothetical protein LTR74_013351 [Friedmanniomyces endolithicus]